MTTFENFLRRVALFAFGGLLASARVASAATDTSPPPVVVVYPFTVSGTTTGAEAGGNVALLLSNRLQSMGGLVVKPYTPGTERHDYLTAAQKQNADYYVTGFLTPIGSEVSLITQVVSIYGGTVVWSNTSTIRTYSDALAQADGLHEAILQHAGRALSSLGAPPPATTPEPSGNDAAGVNLTKALGRHHRDAATVAAAPPPQTRVAAGALVADVGGSATASLRSYASTALASALRKQGVLQGGGIPIASAEAATHVPDICKANPASQTLYASTLDIDASRAVTLDVSAYDCTGKKLGSERSLANAGKHGSLQDAVDRAAVQAIGVLQKLR